MSDHTTIVLSTVAVLLGAATIQTKYKLKQATGSNKLLKLKHKALYITNTVNVFLLILGLFNRYPVDFCCLGICMFILIKIASSLREFWQRVLRPCIVAIWILMAGFWTHAWTITTGFIRMLEQGADLTLSITLLVLMFQYFLPGGACVCPA